MAVVLSVAFFLASRDKLLELYTVDPLKAALSAVLFATTVVWCFRYLHAVRNELDLLESTFDWGRAPTLSGSALATGLGLAIAFGSLVAFCTNILVYSGIATILALCDLIGTSSVCRHLFALLKKDAASCAEGSRQGIVMNYYFGNPLFVRIGTLLTVFASAVFLAFVAMLREARSYEYGSFVVVTVAIVGGELVMYLWRVKRDRALERIPE